MGTGWRKALNLVKPLLLPVWNGGHRAAWRVGEFLGAIGQGRFGRCLCCGRVGPLLRRKWVVWPELKRRWGLNDRLAQALAAKETDCCAWCGAPMRSRRMAEVLLSLFPMGDPPRPARSLRSWANLPEARRLKIAEINQVPGVHQAIQSLPGLSYSEFIPDRQPGSTHDGIRCENLLALSYADQSFDLVLHAETLEHVPDLARALDEIHRVLKPGGLSLFTAPVLPGVLQSFRRARLDENGSIEDLVEPRISHPGGDWGYPVFWELGEDLPNLLQSAGLQPEVHFGPVRETDLAQVYLARRPT